MATKKYLDYAGLKRVLAKLLPGARKIWHGTLAEWENLSATEKAKYDQAEVIDEYTGVPVVVDKVESGNLNPVTSNAVAEALSSAIPGQTQFNIPAFTYATETNVELTIGGTQKLPKGKYILVLNWLNTVGVLFTSVTLNVGGNTSGLVIRSLPVNNEDLSTCTVGFFDNTVDNAVLSLSFVGVKGMINGDVNYWNVRAIKIG